MLKQVISEWVEVGKVVKGQLEAGERMAFVTYE